MVRVLRSATTGRGELPTFDDWEALFVDGFGLLAVQVGYLLGPALVVLGLTLGGVGVFSGLGGTTAGAVVEGAGVLLFLVGALGSLVAVYLLPAAVAHVAHERRLRAGFELRTVAGVGRSTDYFVAVVGLFVGAVLGTLAGVLAFVLVGVFVAFYVQVVVFYLFGQGYADATESDGQAGETERLTRTTGWE